MSTPPLPNLFSFATSELSQDAVLSWVLSMDTDAAPTSAHRVVARELARRMLRPPGGALSNAPDVKAVRKVVQQRSGLIKGKEGRKRKARLDLLVRIELGDGRAVGLVIEDKTGTSHHSNQLEAYKALIDDGDEFRGSYVKTGLITDRDLRAEDDGYSVFDLEDMSSFVREHRTLHPILEEYAGYVDSNLERVNRLRLDVLDPTACKAALKTDWGQWALMCSIFRPGLEPSRRGMRQAQSTPGSAIPGSMVSENHTGGAVVTRFRIQRDSLGRADDEETFRWDCNGSRPVGKKGDGWAPSISLLRWRGEPKDGRSRGRVLECRAAFEAAHAAISSGSQASPPPFQLKRPKEGVVTAEIGRIYIGDLEGSKVATCSPAALQALILDLQHETFRRIETPGLG